MEIFSANIVFGIYLIRISLVIVILPWIMLAYFFLQDNARYKKKAQKYKVELNISYARETKKAKV